MELDFFEILIALAGLGGLGFLFWSLLTRQIDNADVTRKEEKARKASEHAAAVEAVNKNKQEEIVRNQKEVREKVADAVKDVPSKDNELKPVDTIIDNLVDLWNDKFNRRK